MTPYYRPLDHSRIQRKRAKRVSDCGVNTALFSQWLIGIAHPAPPGAPTGMEQVGLEIYQYLLNSGELKRPSKVSHSQHVKLTELNLREFNHLGEGRFDCKVEVAWYDPELFIQVVQPYNLTFYFTRTYVVPNQSTHRSAGGYNGGSSRW